MLYKAYSALRRWRQESDYHSRRERYERTRDRIRPGKQEDIRAQVLAKLASRNWPSRAIGAGLCHTFAFVPQISWHCHLMPDLEELGPVTLYDYIAHGYRPEELWRGRSRDCALLKMNAAMVERAVTAHREKPLDWMLFYGRGCELRRESLRELKRRIGAPMVLMCLDDKQSWSLGARNGQDVGQKDIVAEFDLCWTSAQTCLDWYLAEGALPVYLPEGFNSQAYGPRSVERDIPVSFVGAKYGFRSELIAFLRKHGIDVAAFGPGWENPGVWGEEQVKIFNRSWINLGHGGILHSESLTNVKTRDFEVPGTGGGAYVTTYSRDLAQHFNVGDEIFCYRDGWELVELLRDLLRGREKIVDASRKARERSLKEHRWLHRYRRILELILPLERGRNG